MGLYLYKLGLSMQVSSRMGQLETLRTVKEMRQGFEIRGDTSRNNFESNCRTSLLLSAFNVSRSVTTLPSSVVTNSNECIVSGFFHLMSSSLTSLEETFFRTLEKYLLKLEADMPWLQLEFSFYLGTIRWSFFTSLVAFCYCLWHYHNTFSWHWWWQS